MKTGKKSLWLAILAALALLAAACGSDAADVVADATDDVADVVDDATDDDDAMEDDDAMDDDGAAAMIGEGQQVQMARANWASGYIQAEIYRQVLQELGYEVADPADGFEFSPDLAYQTMADGQTDFWTNSWYPGHLTWWDGERTDGTTIGDHLVKVGGLFENAGVQGWLITKSWADEAGITTLDQINDDPALYGALPDTDGNGEPEVFTCPEDWTCDDIAASMFAFAEYDNVQPLKAGYDAMFAQFLDLVADDKPAIIYTWTPSAYVTQAVPGADVYWLSIDPESLLDDSNPLGDDGGENYAQPDPFTGFGAEFCTQGPDGCNTGWEAADIQVTANKTWAEENPHLIAMFETMRPSVVDISIAQVEQAGGDESQSDVIRIAGEYIAANRDLVDSWKQTAIDNYAG